MQIKLTRMEARHIVMMMSDYMALNPEGYIEENINVISGEVTKTSEIMAKLLYYATGVTDGNTTQTETNPSESNKMDR